MKPEVESFVECLDSLSIACSKAGGNAPIISELRDMNALELIDHISSNNIRFVYPASSERKKK